MKTCRRCVMNDKSDPLIRFDADGYCNYCTQALKEKEKSYFPNSKGKKKLEQAVVEIKEKEKGKKYDCIIGLSGGLDSSYVVYLAAKYKLRALVVHIDDGFDTEISKENVNKLIKTTGFDYKVINPDKRQFYGLLLAFLKSGVPNIFMPQDNVTFAFLYYCMKKYKIRYFLSGVNYATESILQRGNTHPLTDVVHIKDINKRFGSTSLDKIKFIDTNQRIIDRRLGGYKTIMPLNYINYNRENALKELAEFCDFEYYGSKHLENVYTAFGQLYWLPKKFNVDKRTSHLSSMIISQQITREEALEELNKPMIEPEVLKRYIDILVEKLGISKEEFDEIMSAPTHSHSEYKVERDNVVARIRDFLYNIKRSIVKH